MRKTLIAMLGLVALGLWALPALAVVGGPDPAKNPPKVSEPIPLENRAGISQRSGGKYQGTLSGTLIKQSQATTSWFLYPGACTDRYTSSWIPKPTPHADSLNSYTVNTTGPYTLADQSVAAILWHIDDPAVGPASDHPAAVATRNLWCGKFDANYLDPNHLGYPNLTYQILYVDTGAHGGNYTLTVKHVFNAEQNYDYTYVLAGLGGATDPLTNNRPAMDGIIGSGTGSTADGNMLIRWTGATTVAASGVSTLGGPVILTGGGGGAASLLTSTFTVAAAHRALYFVFQADCLFSSEDALWPDSDGQQIDELSVSDTGALYTNEVQLTNSGGFPVNDDNLNDPNTGIVLKGTVTDDVNKLADPTISARVADGVGELWQLIAGNNLPNEDTCSPQKLLSTDKIFEGANPSGFHTKPNQFNSVVTCTFPIPVGSASVFAQWTEYLDLPRFQGYVQYTEFRIHKDGSWGNWENSSPGGGVRTGALKAWVADGDELAAATQADSVQVRYNLQCINFFALDHQNCGDVLYGILYDDFRLEVVTGVPAPIFGVFVGSVAQSMFVDGTMPGDNCEPTTTADPLEKCWPGVRGTDIPLGPNGEKTAVSDNFNSPLGDSITLAVVTGLRKTGKGINWHKGFDKTVDFGLTIAHTNPNFVAAYDAPRMIFRMYDPATYSWSPWDSSELDANAVSVSTSDTALIDSEYRVNWPPRDKVGTTLPISINGLTNYDQIRYMPRGFRLQYYWKGVDLNGGRSYQFSTDALAREAEDLPTLPGSSNVAPDIIQFEVLPGAYAFGDAASQLSASHTTPLLDLDGTYTRWNFATHATNQALRSLGVRADRLRILQGLEEGGHIGGHEFIGRPGFRAGRLSNYFPNRDEYSIVDSLKNWYHIMIESSHAATSVVDEAQDAEVLKDWWTGNADENTGDRCMFASGDNFFQNLLAHAAIPTATEVIQNDFATSVFGVATASDQSITTSGANSTLFPNVNDRFADPLAGPALGALFPAAGAYRYVVDGGCPTPNRFDALTAIGGGEAVASALYQNIANPVTKTDNAAIAYRTEAEPGLADGDQNKSLGYGFSIQFIRQGGENLVDHRAQVLYKFLTSCRGPRAGGETPCWPCPTDANMRTNWATSANFVTGTYGPLFLLQDHTKTLSGVGDGPTAAAPFVNRLHGNFPNPFNPETAIRFTPATAGRVEVRIFDVAGRLVQTLSKTVTAAGVVNEVRWNGKSKNGTDLASGIYFIKVRYPDGREDGLGHKVAIVR